MDGIMLREKKLNKGHQCGHIAQSLYRKKTGGEMGVNEWVSVKDRLPDEKQSEITHDFVNVLCATTFGDVRAYKFGTPIGWNEPHFWHGSGLMDKYVTHWMPMPEMPDES